MLAALQRTAGSNTQTYNFTYDSFGNTTSIKVGSTALASYTYGAKNGLLSSMTYGNNATVSYTYDTLGRLKTATYPDGRVVLYYYTGDGQLYSAWEFNGSSYTLHIYTYDTLGRLVGSKQIKDGTTELRTDQTYNANNQLTKQAWQVGSTTYSETYTYNTTDGSLATHGTATGQTASYSYDALRRVRQIAAGSLYTKSYGYRSLGNNRTTAQVTGLTYAGFTGAPAYGYTYDAMGNISTYTAGGETVTYTYDAQGQLLKAVGDETYTYTYDAAGNILTANGHTYTYGNTNWRDLLTAFDGESITYDAIGNPTSYYNGTRWTFGWSNGRQLTSASNGTNSITYTYTADGMRTSKVVDGVTYNYYYASGKLLRQSWGDNVLDFFYDAQGYPYAMKYNGTPYYYVTNLQGNVERVINSSGSVVAYYGYDPYGRITGTVGDLAEINPLRYRGYVYDTETELYYVSSRYYDPSLNRFINADVLISTGQGLLGNNMFAYCRNNPVSRKDISGMADVDTNMTDDPIKDLMDQNEQGGGAGGNDIVTAGSCTYSNSVGSASSSYTTASTYSGSQVGNYTSSYSYSTNSSTSGVDSNISNIQYTPKVEAQMANTDDLYHAFPSIVDQFIPYGDVSTLIGGDRVVRTYISLRGSINGVNGIYEYIFEPDGTCNHRLFRPFD